MLKVKICIHPVGKQILIYDSNSLQEIGSVHSLKQRQFYEYMKSHFKNITEAVIPPIGSYRNVLYALYPEIKIVIDQQALMYLFGVLNMWEDYESEVAATQTNEAELLPDQVLPDQFITRFYQSHTRFEAATLYDFWQINIPIQPRLYRYIRVMEYFDQEIFNYFDE